MVRPAVATRWATDQRRRDHDETADQRPVGDFVRRNRHLRGRGHARIFGTLQQARVPHARRGGPDARRSLLHQTRRSAEVSDALGQGLRGVPAVTAVQIDGLRRSAYGLQSLRLTAIGVRLTELPAYGLRLTACGLRLTVLCKPYAD